MSEKAEQAEKLFKEGYNCCQAVIAAFADELGMQTEDLLRLASSFGGGMGRLREVCGAVSGMFMIAGLEQGYDDPKAQQEKKEHYERIQRLAEAFQEENGSIVCRELLGLDHKKDEPTPSVRTATYYRKRPCTEMVKSAVRILEKELYE